MNVSTILADTAWLRGLVARLVDDEATIDDIVQSTLVAAWQQSAPIEKRRPWLARVARNALFEQRRKHERRVVREAAAAKSEREPSAAEIHERVEMQRVVSDVVLQLPLEYRTVVFMHYFDGLSLREIAERTDTKIETIRTRHKRALERLRGKLDDRCGGRAAWALVLLNLDVLKRGLAAPSISAVAWLTVPAAALLVTAVAFGLLTSGDPLAEPERIATTPRVETTPSPIESVDPRELSGLGEPERSGVGEPAASRMLVVGRTVTAESREPIGDAAFTLQAQSTTGLWADVASTKTLGDGSFELDATIPAAGGRYRWKIASADRAPRTNPLDLTRVRPDATRSLDLGSVEVAEGCAVRGVVLNASGAAATNTDVYLVRSTGECDHLGATDGSGSFAAEHAVAFTDGEDRLVATGELGTGWTWLDLTRARGWREVRLQLFPGATIDVQVESEEGRPMPDVAVSAHAASPLIEGDWTQRLLGPGSEFSRRRLHRTDERGHTSLRALPLLGEPDDEGWLFSVELRHEGRSVVRGVRAFAARPTRLDVVWPKIEHEKGPPSNATTLVYGVVVDDRGDAVRAARVELVSPQQGAALTDATGAFCVAVADSSEVVRARVVPPAPEHAWTGPRTVELPREVGDVEVRLTRTIGARLSIDVVDREGSALDVRRALLWPDRDGELGAPHPVRCRIGGIEATDLAPGNWATIIVTAAGHTIPHVFEVPAGEPLVDFELVPLGSCSVIGELDLSAVPESERDRPITIAHSFVEGPALWVDPDTGGPLGDGVQVVGAANTLRLAPGKTRFRLDGLTAFRKQIDVFVTNSAHLIGGVEVPIVAGHRSRIALRVRPAATARFEWSGPPPDADLTLWYHSTNDEDPTRTWHDWVTLAHIPAGFRGELPNLTLFPGDYEWAVSDADRDPVRTTVGTTAFRQAYAGQAMTFSGAFRVGKRGDVTVPVRVR